MLESLPGTCQSLEGVLLTFDFRPNLILWNWDIVVNFSDIDILSTTVKIIVITSITTTCIKDRPFFNTIITLVGV